MSNAKSTATGDNSNATVSLTINGVFNSSNTATAGPGETVTAP